MAFNLEFFNVFKAGINLPPLPTSTLEADISSAENKNVEEKFQIIFNDFETLQPEEQKKQLLKFLEEYDKTYTRTPLSYFGDRNSPLNKFCKSIAIELCKYDDVEPTNKNLFTRMFPSLKIKGIYSLFIEGSNDEDYPDDEILLIDENLLKGTPGFLISYNRIIDWSQNLYLYIHIFHKNLQNIALPEKKMLDLLRKTLNHYTTTLDKETSEHLQDFTQTGKLFFNERESDYLQILDSTSPRQHIKKLINGLKGGGAYNGIGTTEEAGEAAYDAISSFLEYFGKLPKEIQTPLGECRIIQEENSKNKIENNIPSTIPKVLNDILHIFRHPDPSDPDPKDCVERNASYLEKILNNPKNKTILDTVIYNPSSTNKNSKLQIARQFSEKIYEQGHNGLPYSEEILLSHNDRLTNIKKSEDLILLYDRYYPNKINAALIKKFLDLFKSISSNQKAKILHDRLFNLPLTWQEEIWESIYMLNPIHIASLVNTPEDLRWIIKIIPDKYINPFPPFVMEQLENSNLLQMANILLNCNDGQFNTIYSFYLPCLLKINTPDAISKDFLNQLTAKKCLYICANFFKEKLSLNELCTLFYGLNEEKFSAVFDILLNKIENFDDLLETGKKLNNRGNLFTHRVYPILKRSLLKNENFNNFFNYIENFNKKIDWTSQLSIREFKYPFNFLTNILVDFTTNMENLSFTQISKVITFFELHMIGSDMFIKICEKLKNKFLTLIQTKDQMLSLFYNLRYSATGRLWLIIPVIKDVLAKNINLLNERELQNIIPDFSFFTEVFSNFNQEQLDIFNMKEDSPLFIIILFFGSTEMRNKRLTPSREDWLFNVSDKLFSFLFKHFKSTYYPFSVIEEKPVSEFSILEGMNYYLNTDFGRYSRLASLFETLSNEKCEILGKELNSKQICLVLNNIIKNKKSGNLIITENMCAKLKSLCKNMNMQIYAQHYAIKELKASEKNLLDQRIFNLPISAPTFSNSLSPVVN